jgi:hypothetical protein
VLGPLGGDGQAEQLARQAHGVVADVDHLLDLAQAFGGDLAGLQRHQAAKIGLGGAKLLAQEPDQFAPPRRGDSAPSQVGRMRLIDRLDRLGGGRLAHPRDLLAGDGR